MHSTRGAKRCGAVPTPTPLHCHQSPTVFRPSVSARHETKTHQREGKKGERSARGISRGPSVLDTRATKGEGNTLREVRGKRGWSTKVNFEVMATRNRCMDLFGGIVKVNLEKLADWSLAGGSKQRKRKFPPPCHLLSNSPYSINLITRCFLKGYCQLVYSLKCLLRRLSVRVYDGS